MKKVVLALTVIFATVGGVKAQTASSSNAPAASSGVKVKVNVELNPFQSIEIGSGAATGAVGYGDEVTLVYNNANDYKNGVSKVVEKQLKVSSVGTGYKINAALSFNSGAGSFGKVSGGGEATVAAADLLQIAISTKGGITSATSGKDAAANMEFGPFGATSDGQSSVLDQELDVKYFGKKLDETLLRKLFGNEKNQAKYTIDVIYTIATN